LQRDRKTPRNRSKMFKTIEMKQTFKIPKGCTEVSIEQTDNGLVIEYVPKEPQFKMGDFVTIFGKPQYWSSECNKNCIREKVNYPFTHIITKIAEVDDFIAVEIADGGWSLNSLLDDNLIRHATEEEKQLLLDKLKEQGKTWNAETLQIEDLPKWKPENGEKYFYIIGYNLINQTINALFISDLYRLETGNYFRTKEEITPEIFEAYKQNQIQFFKSVKK